MIYEVPEADVDLIEAELDEGQHLPVTRVLGDLYVTDDLTQNPPDVDAAVAATSLGYSTLAGWLLGNGQVAEYTIGDYVNGTPIAMFGRPDFGLNYGTGLNRRLLRWIDPSQIVKGEVRRIVYYVSGTLNPDGSFVGTTPVVEESFSYLRTPNGLAYFRLGEVCWYRKDGTLDARADRKKPLEKYYLSGESIDEGRKRRNLILDQTSGGTVYLLDLLDPANAGQPNIDRAKDLWEAHKTAIELYRDVSEDDVLQDLIDDDDPTRSAWLDLELAGPGEGPPTVRDWIGDELDIWS